MGVTQYVKGEQLADFIERADKGLYASKDAGRNQVTVQPAASHQAMKKDR